MNKNPNDHKARVDFISLSMNDSKAAAAQLKQKAAHLEQAKTTTETIQILKEVLYISEATIFRDIRK